MIFPSVGELIARAMDSWLAFADDVARQFAGADWKKHSNDFREAILTIADS